MGLVNFASRSLARVSRGRPRRAALLLGLSGGFAACAHLPPLVESHDPLSAEEHAKLGASYEAQGLKKEAIQQYEAATRQNANDAEAWVALGNLSFESGDLARSEFCFRQALKASPHDAGAGNNLAMAYLAQDKNLADAERLAQEALVQGGPLKPYVLDTLASIYLRQKRYPEAQAAIAQAEAAAPADRQDIHDQIRKTRERITEAFRQ